MKKNFIYIAVSFLLFATFSCSNEFLNDNIKQEEVLSGDSQIMISPSWDTNDYQFICMNAGDADFTVENAPEWLVVETETGKLTAMPTNSIMPQQSIGIIRCKAKANPEFEKVGMYLDKIRISVNGKTCYIPVMYISEGNPKIKIEPLLTLDYNNGYSSLIIQNEGEGILLWDIISMPGWLAVDMNTFNPSGIVIPQGNSSEIPLTFNADSAFTNKLTGNIVLKTNDKEHPEVTVYVGVNLGAPQITLPETGVYFGRTETNKSFSISNHGNGFLIWSLENLPEWLSVSKSDGTLYSYNSENVTFTCNRDLLPDGTTETKIILKTNDVNNPATEITISARNGSNSANVLALEGNIVDVCYDKNTNILYYATSQPNKLIAYNTQTRSIVHEIVLSKSPTCLAISEDFTKAAIGHGGQISAINLNNFELIKTIELDFTVYDMAWASEDWFCFTLATNYNYSNLLWINTRTEETYETQPRVSSLLMGQGYVYKVPNQPFIIGSSTNVFPSGIYITSAKTKDQTGYAHTDLGKLWFSEDGNYIFESNKIYRTSAFTSLSGNAVNDPFSIGSFFPAQEYHDPLRWIDHSSQAHAIWAIRAENDYYYGEEATSQIYQFEDTDYSLVKSYFYEDYYEINGTEYQVQAHYLFANSTDTQLSVLRKGINNNNWSIEFIRVTD